MTHQGLVAAMTDAERCAFQSAYDADEKSARTAVLLAIFGGAFGLHWFYLKERPRAVVYACVFWTLIPLVLGLRDAFELPARVQGHNDRLAIALAARHTRMRRASSPPSVISLSRSTLASEEALV